MGDLEPNSNPWLDWDEVIKASRRISSHLHKTPIFTNSYLNALGGKQLFFKGEHLQKTGSFKARGACNAVFAEKEANPDSLGVVTDSSGNHAQAVAYAARCVDLPCTVVVPRNAPKVKCDAIKDYGATIVLCDPSPTARKETCVQVAHETGKRVIHSSSNLNVMAGQGTLALEMLQEIPNLDAILVPVSGGGMLAGVSFVASILQPKCQVYAVEPVGKDLQKCLESKKKLWARPSRYLDTVADSLRLQEVGDLPFPVICEYANPRVFTLTDEQMVAGMRLVFERMKQVVEAASGGGVYAALHLLQEVQPKASKVGVVLCGGNVDLDALPWLTSNIS